jgi:hypothetical protein
MTIGAVVVGAVLLAGPAYKIYWAMTTRSHPRTQENPPDLSAFQRDARNRE